MDLYVVVYTTGKVMKATASLSCVTGGVGSFFPPPVYVCLRASFEIKKRISISGSRVLSLVEITYNGDATSLGDEVARG